MTRFTLRAIMQTSAKRTVHEHSSEVAADKSAPRQGTLQRGLLILDTLIQAGHPLTLAGIAAEVRLDLSTTLRLLRSLEELGRVMRVGDGKQYLASPTT